jgi:hypothetical protein
MKPPKPPLQGKTLSRLLDAAVEIKMNPETPDDGKTFLARQLVQVTLPHSNPGSMPVWQRRNGNLTLSIRPGWNHKKNEVIGYPYGTIPRLLLFWLTTETLRTNSRRLELGDNLAAFMRQLNLDPGRGGVRSDARRLHDQMKRLFRSTISFSYEKDTGPIQWSSWLDMQVAPKGELWWDIRQPNQATIWGSWIELSEDFHNALVAAPVPVDMRALMALKNSAMALDLYAWAVWRSFTVAKAGNVQFIPWRGLMEQLGSDYRNPNDFRRKARAALKKVRTVYPGLKFEQVDGGINLLPTSRPAVTRREKKLSTKSS